MRELMGEQASRGLGAKGWAYLLSVASCYGLLALLAYAPIEPQALRLGLSGLFALWLLVNIGFSLAALDPAVYIEVKFGEAKPGGSAVGYFPGKDGSRGQARWIGSGNASVPDTLASVEVSESVFEDCLKQKRDRESMRAGRWLLLAGLLVVGAWLIWSFKHPETWSWSAQPCVSRGAFMLRC